MAYEIKRAKILKMAPEKEMPEQKMEFGHLSSFLQSNSQPVIECDFTGKLTFFNESAAGLIKELGIQGDAGIFIPNDIQKILPDMKDKKRNSAYRSLEIADKLFKEHIILVPGLNVVRIYVEEITEISRAMEDINASETRYRRLFETAQDGILILDADTGKITDVNPFLVGMLGYSREEFLGKQLWEIGAVKDIEMSKTALLKLQTEKYIRYEDLPLQDKDGGQIHVEFVSNVYMVDHSKVIQCNVRDISERKLAQDILKNENVRLLAIDKMKSEFVALVAHDLRTPLTSIMGYADTIANKKIKLTDEQRETYLGYIQDESRRLGRLISSFLDIARIEQGKLDLKFQKTDFGQIIDKMTKMFITNTKEILFVTELEPDLPQIYIDPDRIIQAMENLLSNAIKYSPLRTTIKITVKKNNKEIQVSIIDQGHGISDKEKEKIFEKFYRIGSDTLGLESGAGLGLAIVKYIVEKHKGKIWVEDNPPAGSRFIFTLPLNR